MPREAAVRDLTLDGVEIEIHGGSYRVPAPVAGRICDLVSAAQGSVHIIATAMALGDDMEALLREIVETGADTPGMARHVTSAGELLRQRAAMREQFARRRRGEG